jgi:hypothetical protein
VNRRSERAARIARVSEILERIALGHWSAAERVATDAESARDRMRSTLDRSRRELADLRASGDLAGGVGLASERALEHVHSLLRNRRGVARERRRGADAARATWTEKRRERQALERWTERIAARERAEEARLEQRAADETALLRAFAPSSAALVPPASDGPQGLQPGREPGR